MTKFVRCIDDSEFEHLLTNDMIYEIKSDTDVQYNVRCNDEYNYWFAKDRFIQIPSSTELVKVKSTSYDTVDISSHVVYGQVYEVTAQTDDSITVRISGNRFMTAEGAHHHLFEFVKIKTIIKFIGCD